MSEYQESRKQWHPVLVDGLRYLMGDRLRIEPEHAVSVLPTRIDVLVLSSVSARDLDSPYHWLTGTTLVELEGPGEWATWRSLRKLYADGILYSLDQGVEQMSQIGLWLIVSRISEAQLSEVETELGGLERVGLSGAVVKDREKSGPSPSFRRKPESRNAVIQPSPVP